MTQTTRIYKLKDTIDSIDSPSAWSWGRFQCFACRKSLTGDKLNTRPGNLCANCVEAELKKTTRNIDLAAWSISQITKALEALGTLQSRFTVLWRFHEILRSISDKSPSEVEPIKKLLVRNLGYVQDHPLAQPVRQAAFQACVEVGESLVPLLISMCEPNPWQFYANIIMVLGQIAPDHPDARSLIKKAAKHQNPEIRKRAQVALLHQQPAKSVVSPESFRSASQAKKAPDKHERLKAIVHTLQPSLRDFVTIGTEPDPAVEHDHQPLLLASSEEKLMEGLIDRFYTASALKKIYKNYLHDSLFSEANFEVKGKFSVNKLKKSDCMRALAKVFSNKELFQAFFANFPKELQDIFQSLVWEGEEYEAEHLEKIFDANIIKAPSTKYGYGNSQDVLYEPYIIFQLRSQYDWRSYREHAYTYYLSVSEHFRKVFKQYLPAPEGYHLTPLETPEPCAFLYENQDRILQDIKLYCTYIDQGDLKFSKSTGKLLKSSLTQMARYCSIGEFYEPADKNLQYMRTRLIIDFLQGSDCKNESQSLDLLHQLFQNFFRTRTTKSKKLYEFLYHLKGGYYAPGHESREKRVKKSLLQILRTLPSSKWFSFENIEKYCFYRDLDLELVERKSYGCDLYFNKLYDRPFSGGYERVYVRENSYKSAVTVPFLKTMMFLFATFGILDIAYDFPENDILQERNLNYLSPFDGVRYVRLTPLGAYIVGTRKKYESAVQEETTTIQADDKRLILTLEGSDPLKMMVLDKIADRINDTCYKVSYQSFLKDCMTKHEIEQKVTLFKEQVSSTLPKIWQEFLDDVVGKINPLVSKQSMSVFQLKQNKDLISLIARDTVLKQYILKAEDFHIVVASKNIPKVKKRLEEFGYFIDTI